MSLRIDNELYVLRIESLKKLVLTVVVSGHFDTALSLFLGIVPGRWIDVDAQPLPRSTLHPSTPTKTCPSQLHHLNLPIETPQKCIMPPLSLSLAVFLPIIAILLLTRSSNNYELTSPNLSFSSPQTQDFLSSQESGSQDSLSSPYYASWRTWFYPHRTGYVTRSRKGGWNVLYHLGGIGPWVEMDRGKEESGIEVPETCTVDQVHMVSTCFLFDQWVCCLCVCACC